MRLGYLNAAFAAAAFLAAGTAMHPTNASPRAEKALLPAIAAPVRRRRAAPKSGGFYYPNGERERARRQRQIAAGQLTPSNGLRVAA